MFRITGDLSYQTQFSNDVSTVSASTVLNQDEFGYPVMLFALGGGSAPYNATLRTRMRSAILATADEYASTRRRSVLCDGAETSISHACRPTDDARRA